MARERIANEEQYAGRSDAAGSRGTCASTGVREVLCKMPRRPGLKGPGVAVLIISFNTTFETLRCLESLRLQVQAPEWVGILDNAPATGELLRALIAFPTFERSTLRLFQADSNLGFAAGSNALIDVFLRITACMFIILLNNDAVATPALVSELCNSVSQGEQHGLAGGRMHKLAAPEKVDTLGISIYASLMPADRYDLTDPFLGPTGGCAILTRRLIESVRAPVGYVFDPRFFCYCEDTDLVLRANLLGFQPIFVDEVLAFHQGQASTGGGYNDFIAYHGLRNSIWMIAKSIPSRLLLKYGVLFVAAQMLTVFRYLFSGRFRVLHSIYRDAFIGMPGVLEDRRKVMRSVRATAAELDRRISRRFYRRGYIAMVLGQLFNAKDQV